MVSGELSRCAPDVVHHGRYVQERIIGGTGLDYSPMRKRGEKQQKNEAHFVSFFRIEANDFSLDNFGRRDAQVSVVRSSPGVCICR